jgi:hypothetical protein
VPAARGAKTALPRGWQQFVDPTLGREPINGAAEAPKWRTYRAKVTAAKAGGLCKGTLGRDGSHFGVPSGFSFAGLRLPQRPPRSVEST